MENYKRGERDGGMCAIHRLGPGFENLRVMRRATREAKRLGLTGAERHQYEEGFCFGYWLSVQIQNEVSG